MAAAFLLVLVAVGAGRGRRRRGRRGRGGAGQGDEVQAVRQNRGADQGDGGRRPRRGEGAAGGLGAADGGAGAPHAAPLTLPGRLRQEAVEAALGKGCRALGRRLGRVCKALVKKFREQISESLQNGDPAQDTCAAIGFCKA
ncbi:hypothetical protein QYF61_020774 [Mycteria americana]|uniref:Saposin B-type domain-containing protein n=1 Tax=Mycteria americana TaxID=33587 RepID=A0AAN7RUM5_MYCAM|nr:hypothetical protein QYF61_020774 [Mycteria americana]